MSKIQTSREEYNLKAKKPSLNKANELYESEIMTLMKIHT